LADALSTLEKYGFRHELAHKYSRTIAYRQAPIGTTQPWV